MKTKIFLGMLLVGVVPLRAQDYYVVTKENIDVYQYPAAGEVVGKVGTMNSFTAWEAGDGWMEFKTRLSRGACLQSIYGKRCKGNFHVPCWAIISVRHRLLCLIPRPRCPKRRDMWYCNLLILSSRTAKAAKAVRRVMCMSACPVTMVSRSRTAFIHTSAMNLWLYRWKEDVR